jgi:hypothetical protein
MPRQATRHFDKAMNSFTVRPASAMMPLSVPGLTGAMIGDDDPYAAAAQDHVAVFLSDEDEPGSLRAARTLRPDRLVGSLATAQAASTSTKSLPASARRPLPLLRLGSAC